jgi:hypothetical protein
MKIEYFNYFLFYIFLSISLTGCDLFGDEEHCQYETNESKIWNPANNPAVAENIPGNYYIYFAFERSLNLNSLFRIENSCPIGVIDLKVNIVEKLFIKKPLIYWLAIYNIKNVKGKKIKNIYANKAFIGKTDTELYANYVLALDGLLEEGPREYGVICYATFLDKDFSGLLEAEEWAKNSIVKVEYKANFTRWD